MTGPPPSRPSAQLASDSAALGTPQRRITLKINPFKARASTSSSSSAPLIAPSPQDVRISDEDKKPLRPKIKIKPLRGSIAEIPQAQNDAMDVDTPAREPSPSVVVASPVDVITPAQAAAPEALPLPAPAKPKIPRPVKLKPLKEVLLRLIAQIKRKDDYAFFLQPVEPEQVPGYSDVVKNPMDLGTMTEKIEKGQYRSLEQFKDDLLLVTSNAKAFNPPSTLYHTEAAKIESWGLEQISRAAVHVIEYEADWTIDVVADGEPALVGDQDELGATPVAGAGDETGRSGPSRARSPSVVSSAAGMVNLPMERSRRAKSKKILAVTESFEEGWHLPGYKDGVGVFPPCSELAALMLELKLRGKKWTKKERLKREKEGPPYTPEGSLDYYELQHPFPSFRNLVPDKPTVPQLIPLIATTSTAPETVQGTPEASQPPEDRAEEQANKGPQGPVAIALEVLPSILDEPGKPIFSDPPSSTSKIGEKKLQHWTITRNPPRGTRAREDDEDGLPIGPQAKRRRAEPTDYGSFATLMGTIAAENGLKASDFEKFLGQDEQLLNQIRQSIETHSSPATLAARQEEDVLWDSNDFIRDVVYGGVDGLAYFRSLAEFVGEYQGPVKREAQGADDEVAAPLSGALGMPLVQWVLMHIVDPLTHGNHAVLRNAASILARSRSDPQQSESALAEYIAQLSTAPDSCVDGDEKGIGKLDATTLAMMRGQLRELAELEDPDASIEIADLLRAPEELFLAESAWAGGLPTPAPTASSVSDPTSAGVASPYASVTAPAGAVQEQGQELAAAGSALASAGAAAPAVVPTAALLTNAIDRALIAGAEALRALAARSTQAEAQPFTEAGKPLVTAPVEAAPTSQARSSATADSPDVAKPSAEDALERRTRLGLIALAKRAPIDRIARLPPELVPVHIRHIVPTLGS